MGEGRRTRPPGVLGAIVNHWTLSGVLTLQSGVPIAVTQSTNFNAFAGFGTQRPNLVGEPELPAGERSAIGGSTPAHSRPRLSSPRGTSGRNPVRGPSYRNLDLALIRSVPFRSGRALEVRTEIFNATNTPPLANPNGVLGTAAFGTITSAGDPRVIQLALKFHF